MGPSSRQHHQHYSAQTAKGKSRTADPAPYKPKGSRDKNRERDRRYEKDKPSASRQNRPRHGKGQAEEEYPENDLSPFYNSKAPAQEYAEQEAVNPDESDPFEPATTAAPDAISGYDEHYTTAPHISDEQQPAFADPSVQEDATYGYPDPYPDSNYPAARNSGSGSRRHQRDHRPALPSMFYR